MVSHLVPNPLPFSLLYSMSNPNEHKFKTETKPFITMLPPSFPAHLEGRVGRVTQFCPMRHKINTFSEKTPEGTFLVLVKEAKIEDVHSCPPPSVSISLALLHVYLKY